MTPEFKKETQKEIEESLEILNKVFSIDKINNEIIRDHKSLVLNYLYHLTKE